MEKRLIRFGIIGCGRVAPKHAQAIITNPSGRLKAVADLIKPRAETYAREYGAVPYNDYRYLLDDKQIDVINICTPSGLHERIAIEALEANKHVIVEKPMALSSEDSKMMLMVAQKMKKKLCVVLQNRYNPPIQELWKIINNKELGILLLSNATVRWYRPQSYYEDGWHGTLLMDGGVLMNQAIHYVDLLQWLMGDIDTVFSFVGTLAHKIEVDDTGVVVIRFRNGAIGSIEASTIAFPGNIEGSITIIGEKGSVKVGGTALNKKEFWEIPGNIEKTNIHTEQKELSIYGEGHKMVIANMINAILYDIKLTTDGEEGKKSIDIVEAIYKSVKTGVPTFVNY